MLKRPVGTKSLASLLSHKVFSLTLLPPRRMQQSAASGRSCVKAMLWRTRSSRPAPAHSARPCVCACVCARHDSRCLQTARPLQCNLSNETCRRLGSELGGEVAAPHLLLLPCSLCCSFWRAKAASERLWRSAALDLTCVLILMVRRMGKTLLQSWRVSATTPISNTFNAPFWNCPG